MENLKDHKYTDTYGDGYTWYTAAEELGQIGKPAVPHLIGKLNTNDVYELKLALYALMLATQDAAVLALTGDEYIELAVVLSEDYNRENKRTAMQWGDRHKQEFEPNN